MGVFGLGTIFILIFHSMWALALPPVIETQAISTEKIQYGISQEGRPLEAILQFQSNRPHYGAILITEGVHGHEYLGLSSGFAKAGENNFLDSEYFQKGGVLIYVPQVNPDGVANNSRFLTSGLDLNRTFFTTASKNFFTPSEAKDLMKFIETFLEETKLKLLFTVDYHCCGASALIPNEASIDEPFYLFLDKILKSELGQAYGVKKTKDLFHTRFLGTLKDYWNNKFNIPSITFEAKDLNEKSKFKSHLSWWSKLLSHFGQQVTSSPNIAIDLSKHHLLLKQSYETDLNAAYSE